MPSVRTSLAAVRASLSSSRARASASSRFFATSSVAGLDRRLGGLLGVRDDRQRLAGGGGLRLLGLGVQPRGRLLRACDDRQRLTRRIRDGALRVDARRLAQPGRLLLCPFDDVAGLLLGRRDPVLRRALALGDPAAHPLLGLSAHPIRALLRGGDD